MDLGGRDITSVQYQNANNSVQVTDEFMRAVEDGGDFALRARTDGQVIETVNARGCSTRWPRLLGCADPGISTTTPSTTGTPIPRRAGSPHPIPAVHELDKLVQPGEPLRLLKF